MVDAPVAKPGPNLLLEVGAFLFADSSRVRLEMDVRLSDRAVQIVRNQHANIKGAIFGNFLGSYLGQSQYRLTVRLALRRELFAVLVERQIPVDVQVEVEARHVFLLNLGTECAKYRDGCR